MTPAAFWSRCFFILLGAQTWYCPFLLAHIKTAGREQRKQKHSFFFINQQIFFVQTQIQNHIFSLNKCRNPIVVAWVNVFPVSPTGFSHLDVMLVECYDPKADQWNILQTPILEGRSGPGCAVLDDSIFLVGGYSWSMVEIWFYIVLK